MNNKLFGVVFFSCLILLSCSEKKEANVSSPDNKLQLNFKLNDSGKPAYEVFFDNKKIIKKSSLGFDFQDGKSFFHNLEILTSSVKTFNESWKMPWGEQEDVVNHYNELKLELQ